MADRRLRVFHAVAMRLSFTQAAQALCLTQPAVTFQIKQLEEHFNTRLFDRGHGQISLTSAGELVLEYAERILSMSAELDTRVKELTGEDAGVLLIGASMTIAEFLLPQILGEFRVRYPKVLPRLNVANSETVENRVAQFTLDLGFIEAPSHLPMLVSEICTEDELQVLCAPGHALARHASVSPQQLLKHAFVSREPGSGTREVTDKYFHDAGILPESLDTVMELGSPEAIKGLISSGLGFAIMSRASISKEVRLGQLVALPMSPKLTRNLSVVYPKERFRSRLANTFIEFAKEKLRAGAQR